jgi:phospholipid/cholesterol/gamma-HCH transport system permease protein
MVDVAQLVEPRTVTLVVVGSNPIVHPMFRFIFRVNLFFLLSTDYQGCVMSLSIASIEPIDQGTALSLAGDWLIGGLGEVDRWIGQLDSKTDSVIQVIDVSRVTQIDTAGAFLLHLLYQKIKIQNASVALNGLSEKCHELLTLVSTEMASITSEPPAPPHHDIFYIIGKKAMDATDQALAMIAFLGEVFVIFFNMLLRPAHMQWRSMAHEIDVGGYRALPIIAVMMFLIGVVVAYQLGVQLRVYGANIYMVDLSGVAILREFSPLICSVIIAGRTSTSFAALLGTMKVNEEIDALQTMGLSPIERLVTPKILGMIIALPLLAIWGDLFGLVGSMVIAKSMVGISYHAFLDRFRQEVAIKHLYIGLVKTPIFALIIAGIGCFQGFQAEGSAQSVGERTTKAAVQAIFLIILADGLFSILFNWMDI